jgi:hypothetical protein
VRALKAVLVAAFASCSIYDSSLLVDDTPDVVVTLEAGADVDLCQHAEPPQRPAQDDPSDGGDVTFVVAVHAVDFALSPDAGVFGFDLDHTCTCPGPETCVPAANAPQHCDDSEGRDNAGGALIQQYSQLSSAFDVDKINTNIQKGLTGMLMRVTKWNGTPNDGQVTFDVFVSTGTALDDGGANPVPKRDGTDQWAVDPTSVVGTSPPYVAVNEDSAAYVAGGVLVANASFPFSVGSQYGTNFLRLDGAIISGAITSTQYGYSLAGVLTGRWDTRNLLTGMQAAKDPFNPGQYLCGTDLTYVAFKSSICRASDITHSPNLDNTNAACDALSTAVGYVTDPAQLGPLVVGAPASTPCGATYSDQCGN